jgi:hypothetical protein
MHRGMMAGASREQSAHAVADQRDFLDGRGPRFGHLLQMLCEALSVGRDR